MSTRKMRHEIRLEIEETKQKLQDLEAELKKKDDPELKEKKQQLEGYLEKLEKEYETMAVKKETVQVISFKGEEEGISFLTRIPYILGVISAILGLFNFLYAAQSKTDYVAFLLNYLTLQNSQVSVSQWETNLNTNSFVLQLLFSIATLFLLIQTILSFIKKDHYFGLYSLFLSAYFIYPVMILYLYPTETWIGLFQRHINYLSGIMILAAFFLLLRGAFTEESIILTVIIIIDAFLLIIASSYLVFLSFTSLNFLQSLLDWSWAVYTIISLALFVAIFSPRK